MVTVTLELTSRTVLSSGKPQGLMTSLGAGKSFGSGLFSNGQANSKLGQSMCDSPLVPSPARPGAEMLRT
nr:hypothetical protein GCM10020185_31590 [Pseudomonas brassicacearum subsp. brassicacearum]